MKTQMKKMTALLLAAFMLLSVIPLLSTSGAEDAADAREGEVEFVSAMIDGNWTYNDDMDTIFSPGNWLVEVEFNLTMALTGVEIYINVTDNTTADEAYYHEALGDLGMGMNGTDSDMFDFTNETHWYTINVTILSDTTWDFKEYYYYIEEIYDVFMFTHTILEEPALTGEYALDVINFMPVLFNTGNMGLTAITTVNMTVVNATRDVVHETGGVVAPMDYEMMGFTQLTWTPTVEGYYEVNFTYNCSEVDGNAVYLYMNNNVSVMVENVTSYDLSLELPMNEIGEGEAINANITINNTGNVAHDFVYTINVTSGTTYDMGQQLSTGELAPGAEHTHFYSNVMSAAGMYDITVTMQLDGGQATLPFEVLIVNVDPEVEDETVLAQNIYEGDEVTFVANYTDDNGDLGYVTLFIDAVWNETSEQFENGTGYAMVILNATDANYTAGELYDYTWTAVEGEYNYSLYAEDGNGGIYYTEEAVEFTVGAEQFAPELDDLTDDIEAYADENVTFVVNYMDENGDVGDLWIKIDELMLNDTDDNSSNWTTSWEEGEWMEMTNATDNWTGGVNFTYEASFENATYRYCFKAIDPILGAFMTDAVEFTIMAALPTEGIVSGMVTTGEGNDTVYHDADIVIYMEWVEEVTEEFNGTNVTTNVTHVMYYNTTAVNGSYEKILPFGTYTIYVTGVAGYLDADEEEFTLDADNLNETIDFELEIEIIVYTIVVGPFEDADGNAVVGATVSFSVADTRADYTADTNGTGYAHFEDMPFDAIPSGTNMTITKGADTYTWAFGADLPEFPGEPTTHDVTVGPIEDADGNPVANASVKVVIGNDTYTVITDADGNAVFKLPLGVDIPAGADFTATKGDETITWKQGESIPGFEGETDDDDDEESNLWVIILVIVIVIIVIIVIVVLVTKKKPEEKSLEDIEDEEMEEGLGDDYDEDFEDVEEDSDVEDFEDFEPEPTDDEMEGVDDMADEMEDFDDGEDFEDEDFGDYEDDFDDDFDDDI